MSRVDALIRETITGVGAESAPGVQADTITRVRLNTGSLLNTGFGHEMLEVPTESPSRFDNEPHVLGKVVASWGPLNWQLRGVPADQRLESAATPALLSHDILLRHALGTRYAAVGTTTSGTSSTTSSVDVASVAGRKVGELVAVETTAGKYEVRAVSSVGASDLEVDVPFANAPASNGLKLRGVRTFVPAETRNGTLTIEQLIKVNGGTSHEFRARGAFSSSFTMTFGDFGKIPVLAISGGAISFAGPEALSSPSWSLGQNPADDDMGPPLPWRPVLLVDGVLATFEPGSLKLTYPQAADPVGDGTQRSGIGGWLDTSGRDNGTFISGEMNIRADAAEVTAYTAGTIRNFLVMCDPNYGEATTTGAVFEMPRVQIIERSKPVSLGSGRYGFSVKFKLLRDTKTPSSTSATDVDLARAPLRVGLY